jgi:hypothetical protein
MSLSPFFEFGQVNAFLTETQQMAHLNGSGIMGTWLVQAVGLTSGFSKGWVY